MSGGVRLSASERDFLLRGVDQGLRADGRGRHDFRSFEIETGLAPQTNGSARLRCPHSQTDIVVGVKLEIAEPKPEQPGEGFLNFSVDCCAVASPEFQGRDVEDINSELEHILERIYGSSPSIDLMKLCIVENAQVWVVYVDVLVLETGGNLLDHIGIAVKAALCDTRIPKVTVLENSEEGRRGGAELEVSDDPYDSVLLVPPPGTAGGAGDNQLPLCITLSRVGTRTIADASLEEEAVASAQLSVGVSPSGHPSGVQKRGIGALDPAVMVEMLDLASRIGPKIHQQLELLLNGGSED